MCFIQTGFGRGKLEFVKKEMFHATRITFQVGKWTFTLTVEPLPNKDALLVKVTSQTRDNTSTPITTQCYFPDDAAVADAKITPVRIVAKVLKGTNPVKGAKVK